MGDWLDATLRAWAQQRYGLTDVTRVEFDHGQHGPYSDVTPDIDAYVEVSVWTAERERAHAEQLARNRSAGMHQGERWIGPHKFEERYTGDLIRAILTFAAPQPT